MATNETKELGQETWVELTNADVAGRVSFQNQGPGAIFVQATTGSAPSSLDGSARYAPGFGEVGVYLSDLFPSPAGADRLFAYTRAWAGKVWISHA